MQPSPTMASRDPRPPGGKPALCTLALCTLVWTHLAACSTPEGPPVSWKPSREFAAALAEAHQVEAWDLRDGVSFDLALEVEEEAIAGRVLRDVDTGRVRMELESGITAVYDGQLTWVAPAGTSFDAARHVRAWPFFVALPFLATSREADLVANLEPTSWNGKPYTVATLLLSDEVRLAPNAWYVLWMDPITHRLAAVIVGQHATEAIPDPPEPWAIFYDDYVDFGGAQVSTSWTIHGWDEAREEPGGPIGSMQIGNLRFFEAPVDAFVRPVGSRQDPRPPALPES